MPPAASAPGVVDFDGLTIVYDPGVLEPRVWTADQSRWAAELLARPDAPGGRVLELCTGAGQIGLRAIRDLPRHLVCVDIDERACDLARANAARNGLADRVEVRRASIAEAAAGEVFALVIADPPWVPRSRVGDHPHDPVLAIDGGEDGLDIARACVAAAPSYLAPGASLLLQLGDPEQVERLTDPLAAAGLRPLELLRGERGVVVRCVRVSPG